MAISILSGTPGTPGTDGGGSASVTFSIPSTVPDGSLIVAIHCNDYRDYSNMVAPTLDFGSPTMQSLGGNDGGSLLSHIKVWAFDYPAGATGTARTLTCTETGTHDGDKGLSVFALSGAATAASCLDGTLTATGSPSSSQSPHVLNGVTTGAAGSMLFGHIRTSNGAGGVTFTAPGSMTEQYDVANFTQFTGAVETLAGTGATGTRTFTPTGSVPWVGVLFAIAPAAGASTGITVISLSGPGRVAPGGRWQLPPLDFTLTSAATPAAENASATGAAFDATVSVAPNAETTSGTGTVNDAQAAAGANAENAVGTGSANAPTVDVQVNAGNSTGTGTANDGQAAITVNAETTTATGVANDATVSTASFTNANAESTAGTGAANDASVAIAANAENAAATGTAFDASVSVACNAEATTATGSAFAAAGGVGALAEASLATGTANVAALAIQANAEASAALGAALDPTVSVGGPGNANAGNASAVGTAYNARVQKLILRPNTGITARPTSGTTTRPDTGITQRP